MSLSRKAGIFSKPSRSGTEMADRDFATLHRRLARVSGQLPHRRRHDRPSGPQCAPHRTHGPRIDAQCHPEDRSFVCCAVTVCAAPRRTRFCAQGVELMFKPHNRLGFRLESRSGLHAGAKISVTGRYRLRCGSTVRPKMPDQPHIARRREKFRRHLS